MKYVLLSAAPIAVWSCDLGKQFHCASATLGRGQVAHQGLDGSDGSGKLRFRAIEGARGCDGVQTVWNAAESLSSRLLAACEGMKSDIGEL